MQRGYDAFNPDGRADYSVIHGITKSKVGDKGLSLDAVWAESPHTLNEVGSTFSIQGFDLNYVGVIIGPSVTYREGKIVFNEKASCNKTCK